MTAFNNVAMPYMEKISRMAEYREYMVQASDENLARLSSQRAMDEESYIMKEAAIVEIKRRQVMGGSGAPPAMV